MCRRVLDTLSKSQTDIPTEEYVVQKGDTICGLLDARHYPMPCPKLAHFVDTLNPQTMPYRNGIKQGDKLILPGIELKPYVAANAYSQQNVEQKIQAAGVLKNYGWLAPHALATNDDRIVIEYKAYEMHIPTKDDATASELGLRLQSSYGSRNVFIDVLKSKDQPVKLNSAPRSDKLKLECGDNSIVKSTYRYADLADADTDALGVVESERPLQGQPVDVWIIDVPILPSPNLYGSFGDKPPVSKDWHCHWGDFRPAFNHSTHMAGIIASQAFGFLGLATQARIQSFVWANPSPDGLQSKLVSPSEQLKLFDLINANLKSISKPLPVYLAASSFPPPNRGDDITPDTPLASPSDRLVGRIANAIVKMHPLFVVSAGQVDTGEAKEISATVPLTPQHFGDEENVLVVSACDPCRRDDTRIAKWANYNRAGQYFVHVAAPGGGDIPGWISPDDIGATPGTSQAAAYVAGVAASMISSFPQAYVHAYDVKSRIQVTSRPLQVAVGGVAVADQAKVTTGVVDPILALLNPAKDWLKDGTGWHEVKVRSALIPKALDANGQIFAVASGEMLRMVKIAIPSGSSYWTFYTDAAAVGENVASVGRVGPVSLDGKASLLLCDGRTVDMESIDDFIPSVTWGSSHACTR